MEQGELYSDNRRITFLFLPRLRSNRVKFQQGIFRLCIYGKI